MPLLSITLRPVCLVVMLLIGMIGPPAVAEDRPGRNIVVVLPSGISPAARLDINAALDTLFMQIGPGDRVDFIDAHTTRRISQVIGIATARNVRQRNRAYGQSFAAVRAFVDETSVTPDVEPDDLNIPVVLDSLASTVLTSMPGRTADVLMLGSMLYEDHRQPGFRMTGPGGVSQYPSDAHLSVDHSVSPYGGRGRENALTGAQVHLCYVPPPGGFITDFFREAIEAWWWKSLRARGAVVGSIAPVSGACMERFFARSEYPVTYKLDSSDPTPRMIMINPNVPPTRSDPPPVPLFSAALCSGPPPRTPTPVWVGIQWTAPVDLDLYARETANAEWLFFAHRTPSNGGNGRFDHDFVTPTGGSAYELIDFSLPVKLDELQVAVNVFAGTGDGDGIPFTIRFLVGNCAYEARMKVDSSVGNGGRRPMQAPFWRPVRPLDVMATGQGRPATGPAPVHPAQTAAPGARPRQTAETTTRPIARP